MTNDLEATQSCKNHNNTVQQGLSNRSISCKQLATKMSKDKSPHSNIMLLITNKTNKTKKTEKAEITTLVYKKNRQGKTRRF